MVETGGSERADRPVEAVFFDLFGTLLDLSGLIAECETAAPGQGAKLAATWRTRQLEFSWLRTAMGTFADFDVVTADALDAAFEELALESGRAEASRLVSAFERLPVQDAARAVLDALRSAGVVTGILTNASQRTLDLVAGQTGLDHATDHRLSVDPAGRFKPDPAVYQLACDATGLERDRIGFVTGNGWDAAGAAAFGFRVVWLRPDAAARIPRVGAPEPRVATWPTLAETLLERTR